MISNHPAKDNAAFDITIPQSAIGWPDSEKSEFNKDVLASMNIEFTEKTMDGVYWVRWKKGDQETEDEIMARVEQFGFIRDTCPQLPLPKPHERSKEKLSCKNNPDWLVPEE